MLYTVQKLQIVTCHTNKNHTNIAFILIINIKKCKVKFINSESLKHETS